MKRGVAKNDHKDLSLASQLEYIFRFGTVKDIKHIAKKDIDVAYNVFYERTTKDMLISEKSKRVILAILDSIVKR